jgi:hypothetical protein
MGKLHPIALAFTLVEETQSKAILTILIEGNYVTCENVELVINI